MSAELPTERTELYRGGTMVSITPFAWFPAFTLAVRKERELGSDFWRPASFSIPMFRIGNREDVATFGRALLRLAEIATELDAEFPPGPPVIGGGA